MSEADDLLLAYAEQFPEEFAAGVHSAATADLVSLLRALPRPLAVGILARLPISTLRRVNAALADELGQWLDAASFESKIALLVRLPRGERTRLISAVSDRRAQRRIRQTLNFPSHSIGSLVRELPVHVPVDKPLDELLSELREERSRIEVPVVLIDEEGGYAGVLDLWRVAIRDAAGERCGRYARRLEPLSPEMPLASARELEVWNRRPWLPVVDHGGRLLGYVRRQQIFGIRETASTEAEIVRDSIMVLCVRYVEALAEMLQRLLGARERP